MPWEAGNPYVVAEQETHIVLTHDLAREKVSRVTRWEWLTGRKTGPEVRPAGDGGQAGEGLGVAGAGGGHGDGVEEALDCGRDRRAGGRRVGLAGNATTDTGPSS
ncbi:hypothetical protein ABZU75_44185 [Streptosporangium sp. NPDC005286]|uniref:hypothetical protein n=1 Tax=Streptosporangium sp. NPDC005286 TaxID=3154463 RepID=UPI0033B58838